VGNEYEHRTIPIHVTIKGTTYRGSAVLTRKKVMTGGGARTTPWYYLPDCGSTCDTDPPATGDVLNEIIGAAQIEANK
jgi:hypothetical protein